MVSVYLQGGRKYQIKGCAGQGGFAQVFKACIDNNPDEIVALKVGVHPFQIHYGTFCKVPSHHHIYMLSSQVQKPPFPWEFHMYRQLDCRIPENQVLHATFSN